MSLHRNIFFRENNDVLVISFYLTAAYKCDQDMIATLNIGGVVLKSSQVNQHYT